MKKIIRLILKIILYFFLSAVLLGIFLVLGATSPDTCESGWCSMCPSVIFNPYLRPISFAVYHIPNALNHRPLSGGCDSDNLISFTTIFDLFYYLFIIFFLKKFFKTIRKKDPQNTNYKDEIKSVFSEKTLTGKSYLALFIIFLLLVFVDCFFYYFFPHTA